VIETRSESLERLATEQFDVLVVGAGITGARIAYDVARAGLRVALVDAGDIGGATSSASSKLLHGGFRYLSFGSYALVRSAQVESRMLATRVAPHLSRPLPVVLGMERDRWPEWQLSCGLLLYFGLSGFQPPRPRLLNAAEAAAAVPCLRADQDQIHLLMHEFQTDDGRLVLATAVGAARAGAVVAPYVDVVSLEAANGRLDRAAVVDRLGGERVVVRARCVVNATGPWVDRVRRLEDARAHTIARLSKGAHVTIPLPPELTALVAFYSSGDRTSFATPWRGTLLLGTTDTEYEGDPGDAVADEGDVAEVLAGGRRLLGDEIVDGAPILSSWAGVRVLPREPGDTASVPREHLVEIGPRGMISVAGGKLTTHRRIAADVIGLLPPEVRPHRLEHADEPLPGSSPFGPDHLEETLDATTAAHLRSLYGSEATSMLAYEDVPGAFERIHPDAPDVWAQVFYGREHEWACTVDDVLGRRTTLSHRGLATGAVRKAVSSRLARTTVPAGVPG
jgi:glycerol-3-phosphate dehydrogenase